MTTIRDVAKRAGVGVGTVSRVLNQHPAVSDATRAAVQEAIASLNYTPNPSARRLSSGRTLTIAIIVPFFTRPSFVERLRGIVAALSESEYQLVIYNVETPQQRDLYLHDLPRRSRFDGVLVLSLTPTDAEAERMQQSGVPVVLVDAAHPLLHGVGVDDVAGGRLATQHLIDLGHTRIGFISDLIDCPYGFVASQSRLQGYRQALAGAGLVLAPDYQQEARQHGVREAHATAELLLDLPQPPTAIFAASDTQAFGVLQAARARRLDVPAQLSVIGYDDIEMAEFWHLTTVRQPLFASGIEGANRLLAVMAAPLEAPRQIQLPLALIPRQTTASLS